MTQKPYYHAYDDRYRQIHEQKLQWFCDEASPIVEEVMRKFSITPKQKILEIGCGEGRDAFPLLRQGYDLLATDVSAEAIRYCREKLPGYEDRFQVLDCVCGRLEECFDFIFAVAVVHMLVADADRDSFYRFIRDHLTPSGIALICTMGDGQAERQSDIRSAFDLQSRIHEPTGTPVCIAGTSCRMVSFATFLEELKKNGLFPVKQGLTSIEPDFPKMMFTIVRSR